MLVEKLIQNLLDGSAPNLVALVGESRSGKTHVISALGRLTSTLPDFVGKVHIREPYKVENNGRLSTRRQWFMANPGLLLVDDVCLYLSSSDALDLSLFMAENTDVSQRAVVGVHNTYLLDYLKPEEVFVLRRINDTTFAVQPLSEAPVPNNKPERCSTGELYDLLGSGWVLP